LKSDLDIIFATIKQNFMALGYAYLDEIDTNEFWYKAIALNYESFGFATIKQFADLEFMINAVKIDGRVIERADISIKDDYQLILNAFVNNQNIFEFIRPDMVEQLKSDPLIIEMKLGDAFWERFYN
jgi:hypothetical protein